MRVLVACEFSGIVRDAFASRGHDAWSCDLLPSERRGNHIEGDISIALEREWDLIIAHPPCTYITLAGNKWFKPEYRERFPERASQREAAIEFAIQFFDYAERVAVENPIGVLSSRFRKPEQIIEPYEFGEPHRKPTCLWLKGLPKLKSTKFVWASIKVNRNGKTASLYHDAALSLPASERWKARSRTFQGIADAMAEQWG